MIRNISALCFLSLLLLIAGMAAISFATPIDDGLFRLESPADVQYRNGINALAKGELNNAEAAFRESLKLDPKLIDSFWGWQM